MAEERINKKDGDNPKKSGTELSPEELEKVSGGAKSEMDTKAHARGEASEKASVAGEAKNKRG